MRKKEKNYRIGSVITSLLILFVTVVMILLSLDLCNIITLPDRFSLRSYISVFNSYTASEEVYYPDYTGTGTTISKAEEAETAEVVDSPQFVDDPANTTDYNVTDNNYFYNQLNVYGKIIYSKIYSSLDDMKTGTYSVNFGTTFNELLQKSDGEQKLTDAFQLSINALLLDHPEIFYIDVTKLYMFTETTQTVSETTYKVSIGTEKGQTYLEEGFASKDDVLIAEARIENVLDEVKTLTQNLNSTYEKIKAVHNYLIDNISYDSNDSSSMSHEIYGALINKLAVCDGYAKSFKYLLDNLQISCVEVCGVGTNSNGDTENHAWNDVLLNGTWYAVDVTWDDPIIVGGNGKLTDDMRYTHFLSGSSTFYSSHQEDGYIVSNGSFSYPTISASDY